MTEVITNKTTACPPWCAIEHPRGDCHRSGAAVFGANGGHHFQVEVMRDPDQDRPVLVYVDLVEGAEGLGGISVSDSATLVEALQWARRTAAEGEDRPASLAAHEWCALSHPHPHEQHSAPLAAEERLGVDVLLSDEGLLEVGLWIDGESPGSAPMTPEDLDSMARTLAEASGRLRALQPPSATQRP